MIAAMISFGIIMAQSAYVSGKYIRKFILEQEAVDIATKWADFADLSSGTAKPQIFETHDKEADQDGILNLRIVTSTGAKLHEEMRDSGTRALLDKISLPDDGEPRKTLFQSSDGEQHLAVVSIALSPQKSDAMRYLLIAVDQSSGARMLTRTLGFFSLTTAIFVWIALCIPALMTLGRMRERRALEKRMHHMAHHDSLTGLPNRTLFNLRLSDALENVRTNKTPLALFCIDLDKFKEINDTLGHVFGDMLLVQVAKRFGEILRSGDLVARLGGDEFVVISENIKNPIDIGQLAKRLVDHLAKPYSLEGNTVVVAASVGIAMAPDDGTDPITLLKSADLALYRTKAEARGSFRFFEPSMNAELQLRRDLESDLRDAVVRGGFALHYQPQYDLSAMDLVGYEALVRWPHPTKGFIHPGEFIMLAEETGLIIPLGEWILRRACLDALIWPENIKIAVNLSPAQFMKNDVADMVKRIIEETGINPRRLELEITESLLLQNTNTILEQLGKIRDLGVAIAMDDFGTGYSSLSYLSRFPFDKIKIDQTFVQNLDKDPSVAAIVNSIVGLGSTLSMTVIAEGVETQAQAELLRKAGCKHVQGFLYGKPMPTLPLETSKEYKETREDYSALLTKLDEEQRTLEERQAESKSPKVA